MTNQELFNYSASEIRADETLISFFKEAYKEHFGNYPSCASCSIGSEYDRLKRKSQQQTNTQVMENANKTFEVYPSFKRYVMRPFGRAIYLENATDENVLEYLKPKLGVDVEARKKYFKKLPEVSESVKIFELNYTLHEATEIIHEALDTRAKTKKGLENALENATQEEIEALKLVIENR